VNGKSACSRNCGIGWGAGAEAGISPQLGTSQSPPATNKEDYDIKLAPKQWDEYNPVLILMGLFFAVSGAYVTLMMPGLAHPIVWLVRAPFALLAAVGSILLIRQFQLRRKRDTFK
jgi:hypothetical protein